METFSPNERVEQDLSETKTRNGYYFLWQIDNIRYVFYKWILFVPGFLTPSIVVSTNDFVLYVVQGMPNANLHQDKGDHHEVQKYPSFSCLQPYLISISHPTTFVFLVHMLLNWLYGWSLFEVSQLYACTHFHVQFYLEMFYALLPWRKPSLQMKELSKTYQKLKQEMGIIFGRK